MHKLNGVARFIFLLFCHSTSAGRSLINAVPTTDIEKKYLLAEVSSLKKVAVIRSSAPDSWIKRY